VQKSYYKVSAMLQDLGYPFKLRPFVFVFIHCLKSNHYDYLQDRIHERFFVFLKHSQTHDVLFTKPLYKSFLQKCLQKCLPQNYFKNTGSDCVNIRVNRELSFPLENLMSAIRNGIRMIVGHRVIFPNYKGLPKIRKH
jgi:hypothetical protein